MDWLILNTSSAAGCAPDRMDRVRRRLTQHQVACEEHLVATIPEIIDVSLKAAASRVDRLWVLGGDGTLAAAAQALTYTDTMLCPLPGGTVNVFCREMSIPADPADAVSALMAGGRVSIDVGQLAEGENTQGGDMKFLLMASCGIDAEAVRTVGPGLKRRLGKWAYVLRGILIWLARRPCRMSVTDEHGIDRVAYQVFVQNARMYGGSSPMAPKAKIDDGRFDVILVKKSGRIASLRFFLSISSGSHVRLAYVEYLRTHTVTIRASGVSHAWPVQSDGDCVAKLPVKLTILPKSLHVLVPRSTPPQ